MPEYKPIRIFGCLITAKLLKRLLLVSVILILANATIYGVFLLVRDQLLASQARAANWGIVWKLLEWGANPDTVDKDGVPPICYATIYQDRSGLNFLIDADANVNPPLHIKHSMKQAWIESPLAMCVSGDAIPLARMLLKQGARVTGEEMSRVRSKSMLDMLIIFGGDIKAKNKWGFTAMTGAAGAEDDNPELVQYLLQAGLSPKTQGRDGLTPLHCAVEHGNIRIAEVLLRAGADVNAAAPKYTALRIAVRNKNGEMAAMLRKHGGHE